MDQLVSKRDITNSSCWFSLVDTIQLQLWSTSRIGTWANSLHCLHISICRRHRRTPRESTTYADDTQLYVAFTKSTATASIHNLETCLVTLQAWFAMNGHALNPDKTQVIQMLTTWRDKELLPVTSVNVAGSTVQISDQLKLLGVIVDAAFSFDGQTKNVCKVSFFHIFTFGCR